MHLRPVDKIKYMPSGLGKLVGPIGLVQMGLTGYRHLPDLTRSGYLDYCGSTFAPTMELATKAVANVFKLAQVLEYRMSDLKSIEEAVSMIDREDRIFDFWTVLVCKPEDKIAVAFSRARDAVEFQLCLPVSTEA